MAALMKEIRHEGTLPGKTLARAPRVTTRYLLYSSSFALRDLDVELVRAVSLPERCPDSCRLAFKVTDATSVSLCQRPHGYRCRPFHVLSPTLYLHPRSGWAS